METFALKKVKVEQLRVGAYVEKIDHSWLATPFLMNKFKLTSDSQIEKMKKAGITEVTINTEKGLDPLEMGPCPLPMKNGPSPSPIPNPQSPIEFTALPVEKLLVNTTLPFDVHIKKEGGYDLYLREGLPFHSEVQRYLESHNLKTVYIPSGQRGALASYEKETEKAKELYGEGIAPGFESAEKVARYNEYINHYVPMDGHMVTPGTKLPVNLYVERDTVVTLILARDSVIPETAVFCERSNGKLKENLLIHAFELEAYKKHIKDMLQKNTRSDKEGALVLRTALIKENTKLITKELMNNPRSGAAMREAKDSVSLMMDSILEAQPSFYSLTRITSHDYYTYTHSINVSTLAIGLGMSMGMKQSEIFHLAVGALAHDVGKSQIPAQLINKPGKLTEEEFKSVKRHVTLGYEALLQNEEVSKQALFPLLQHHEKMNGKGYPHNIGGDKIHPFGRITAIVDVYDALTTERAYKKAFKPFEAANILSKHADEYDREILKKFILMLGKQNMQAHGG